MQLLAWSLAAAPSSHHVPPCCIAGPTNDSASSNTTANAAASTESVPQQDVPALESAADAEAHAVTSSLSPNATNQEVALASAKAAIIYQMASEATYVITTTTSTTTSGNEVSKASEGPAEEAATNQPSTNLPQVLVDRVVGLQLQR